MTKQKPVVFKPKKMPTIKVNKKRKLRILWYSDFLRHTGFGNVAEEIVSRLHKTGKYEFVVLGINYSGVPYCQPSSEYYHLKDIPVYPAVTGGPESSLFGYDILKRMLLTQDFDIFFCLQDAFNLLPMKDTILEAKKKQNFKYVFYFPVDGDIKKSWVEDAIKLADKPVTYTKYGKKKVEEYNSYLDIDVIPHGIDLTKFKPFKTEKEKYAFRRYYMSVSDDEFLITNVNRNQPRKDLPRTIIAFREFCKKNKKIKARLYLHCQANDGAGHRLHEFIQHYLPEALWSRISMPTEETMGGNGVPIETLSNIYAASDIITSSAYGEGWGMCLHPESMIKTSKGYKEINNIKKGEYVLTRKGYKEIIATTNRKYTGELINITVKKRATSLSLKLTPEHKVLTKQGWKKAKELKTENTLYIAKDNFKPYKRHVFDLAKYCNNLDYCRSEKYIWCYGSKKKNLLRYVYLNKDFAELYGIYLAEGCGGSNSIVFSISQEEEWLTNRIIKLVSSVWGLNVNIRDDKNSKKRWIEVCSKILKVFYTEIAGKGARNKSISIINKLTKHTASKILIGFWYGDGSTESCGYEMTTCSKQLAHDLSQLGDKLGMRLTIEHNVKRDCYRLRTNKDYAYTLSMMAGNQKFEKYGFNSLEDIIEVPIKKLGKTKYSGLVYDISIEGEHEFQTNQCIVHNSTIEGMACKTPVVIPDNSASTEIVGKDRGYLVKSGETLQDHDVHKFDNELMRPLTNIDDLVRNWEEVYKNPIEAKKRAENAYKWLQNYTWDKIAKQWEKILDNAGKKNEKCI